MYRILVLCSDICGWCRVLVQTAVRQAGVAVCNRSWTSYAIQTQLDFRSDVGSWADMVFNGLVIYIMCQMFDQHQTQTTKTLAFVACSMFLAASSLCLACYVQHSGLKLCIKLCLSYASSSAFLHISTYSAAHITLLLVCGTPTRALPTRHTAPCMAILVLIEAAAVPIRSWQLSKNLLCCTDVSICPQNRHL